jgi:hypothetical protein
MNNNMEKYWKGIVYINFFKSIMDQYRRHLKTKHLGINWFGKPTDEQNENYQIILNIIDEMEKEMTPLFQLKQLAGKKTDINVVLDYMTSYSKDEEFLKLLMTACDDYMNHIQKQKEEEE